MAKPTFIIKENSQKVKNHFRKVLTRDILKDICFRITGETEFICRFKDNAYSDKYFAAKKTNEGRLAILKYSGKTAYIFISLPDPKDVKKSGRNSWVESVGVLYNKYFLDDDTNKEIYYYFLGKKKVSTPYLNFQYRVFKTIGFNFLNDKETLGSEVQPFTTIEDVITLKTAVTKRSRNKKNNPTFLIQNGENKVQLYGKTFGAHKYETSMLCYVLATLNSPNDVELFEITDNGLTTLPGPSQKVISQFANIKICSTSITLEKKNFEKKDSLRSPVYILNLLESRGQKKCALCDCVVHQLIQGAHIWPVAKIKKREDLSFEEKFEYATDGNNGVWLCENHHKLFDANLMLIKADGDIDFIDSLSREELTYINKITENVKLPATYITSEFEFYLKNRYEI
ncbi:Uncharacterised protein [uncultured Clostridium sp.]|nr:HNH endonuclease [Firmicutes bacterium AM41-5BH]SCH44275.1 Uncharacterised protein [uncultured Clostridium sp.]